MGFEEKKNPRSRWYKIHRVGLDSDRKIRYTFPMPIIRRLFNFVFWVFVLVIVGGLLHSAANGFSQGYKQTSQSSFLVK